MRPKLPKFALMSLVGLEIVSFILAGSLIASQAAAQGDEPVPTQIAFDPSNFIDPTLSTNPYHPTSPGTQWIRAGTTEIGSRKVPHLVISTMTDVMRVIDGVPVVAMLDQSTDSGEISQVGFDYLALDKDGNLWIMGGYTEDFEGGVFTNIENAWLGAETGGAPGILMPAVVTMDTPRWYIGTPGPEEDPSVAEPVSVGITTTVQFAEFHDVIAIREGGIGAIDNEVKYYAPGVGVILNVPQIKSLHQDSFELVNIVELTPEGLAEASQVVLDLEQHAREVAPRSLWVCAKVREGKPVMPAPVVRLVDVSKNFESAAGLNSVLEGVDLEIVPGQQASLVGPSGSGKSTLLSLIAGLVRPDTGTVELDGHSLSNLADDEMAALRAMRIGIAMQSDNLIPFLSALENVELALGFGGRSDGTRRALALLDRMGVAHRASHFPRQLSGGEAQRVSLGVALANDPVLLLADEMVAQLDVSTASAVVSDIFDSGMAVLFVTHDPVLADRADLRLCVRDRRVWAR